MCIVARVQISAAELHCFWLEIGTDDSAQFSILNLPDCLAQETLLVGFVTALGDSLVADCTSSITASSQPAVAAAKAWQQAPEVSTSAALRQVRTDLRTRLKLSSKSSLVVIFVLMLGALPKSNIPAAMAPAWHYAAVSLRSCCCH